MAPPMVWIQGSKTESFWQEGLAELDWGSILMTSFIMAPYLQSVYSQSL